MAGPRKPGFLPDLHRLPAGKGISCQLTTARATMTNRASHPARTPAGRAGHGGAPVRNARPALGAAWPAGIVFADPCPQVVGLAGGAGPGQPRWRLVRPWLARDR